MKILIVENDMPIALLMVNLLSRAGCDVELARTGKAGIAFAQESKFDLITLEVDLPDISGFGICSDLKQRHYSRHTPVVFISARSSLEDQQHGLDVGAADYITKPFETFELAPRLLSHIKSTSNGFDDHAAPFASITKNAEFGRAKVLHGIADKVL
jgi:putative two-component system response regulator